MFLFLPIYSLAISHHITCGARVLGCGRNVENWKLMCSRGFVPVHENDFSYDLYVSENISHSPNALDTDSHFHYMRICTPCVSVLCWIACEREKESEWDGWKVWKSTFYLNIKHWELYIFTTIIIVIIMWERGARWMFTLNIDFWYNSQKKKLARLFAF